MPTCNTVNALSAAGPTPKRSSACGPATPKLPLWNTAATYTTTAALQIHHARLVGRSAATGNLLGGRPARIEMSRFHQYCRGTPGPRLHVCNVESATFPRQHKEDHCPLWISGM